MERSPDHLSDRRCSNRGPPLCCTVNRRIRRRILVGRFDELEDQERQFNPEDADAALRVSRTNPRTAPFSMDKYLADLDKVERE